MTYRHAEYPHSADLMTLANCADDTDDTDAAASTVHPESISCQLLTSTASLLPNGCQSTTSPATVAQIETIRHFSKKNL